MRSEDPTCSCRQSALPSILRLRAPNSGTAQIKPLQLDIDRSQGSRQDIMTLCAGRAAPKQRIPTQARSHTEPKQTRSPVYDLIEYTISGLCVAILPRHVNITEKYARSASVSQRCWKRRVDDRPVNCSIGCHIARISASESHHKLRSVLYTYQFWHLINAIIAECPCSLHLSHMTSICFSAIIATQSYSSVWKHRPHVWFSVDGLVMCRKATHPHPTSKNCTCQGFHRPAPLTDPV